MLKSDAISQAPPRTAQPSARPARDPHERTNATTHPAAFQRLLARARGAGTSEAQTPHDATPLARNTRPPLVEGSPGEATANEATRPSESRSAPFEGSFDAAQRPERDRARDDRECALDAVPLVMGEAPGAPFVFASAEVAAAASGRGAATTVDELFAQMVMRAAVDRGGDAKRGSMRLELGGRVVGRGHVTVHAEGDDVEIEVAAPPGVDADELAARVTGRLAAKGVRVTRFDVR